MFIVGILSWWYGAGWKGRLVLLRERLTAVIDFFSIGLLLRTLFSPFRQISAGQVDGSLEVKLRAFADKLISRLIGAMVRTFVIIAGCIAIVFYVVFGGVMLILWGAVPLLPVIGIVLSASGWVPWTI